MVKVEVVKNFTLEEFNKLENVEKTINRRPNEFGTGDKFECDQEMADYLMGGNDKKETVVKVIEIIPEVKKPIIEEPKKTTKKKKTSKK